MDPRTWSEHFSAAALAAFHRTAGQVPAYQTLLQESGVIPAGVVDLQDFVRLPVLDKRNTFQRFEISQLCRDGQLGPLESVLTSSGHSGRFSFGLTARGGPSAASWTDDLLDQLFQVRAKPTLLINCLPMGVKVATHACTLAETSVRADMAVALVRTFGRHFAQIIFVGEPAFLKSTLELGVKSGVEWGTLTVQVIVGEEPLAENGRKYLAGLLGGGPQAPSRGRIISSMGVAEIGLNLFFEAPPADALVRLRSLLHENAMLRHQVCGPGESVPCLFAYDPRRIFVEFDREGRLLVTTLDPSLRLPLIRYATGDLGQFLVLPDSVQPILRAAGISGEELAAFPLVALVGRGGYAEAAGQRVTPEAVKEGLYLDPALAALTTANFRLTSGVEHVCVRLQLAPGVAPGAELAAKFAAAVRRYVRAPVEVSCEAYAEFGHGMTLDYERKFDYLESNG